MQGTHIRQPARVGVEDEVVVRVTGSTDCIRETAKQARLRIITIWSITAGVKSTQSRRVLGIDETASDRPEQLQSPELEMLGAWMHGRAPMAFNVERRNPVPREEDRRGEADQAPPNDQNRDILASHGVSPALDGRHSTPDVLALRFVL
jgi:hypothetical protein